MSDTPRVDAYVGILIDGVSIFDYREFTEFARQLERALIAKTKEYEELKANIPGCSWSDM